MLIKAGEGVRVSLSADAGMLSLYRPIDRDMLDSDTQRNADTFWSLKWWLLAGTFEFRVEGKYKSL
jgi:hypothetical protein